MLILFRYVNCTTYLFSDGSDARNPSFMFYLFLEVLSCYLLSKALPIPGTILHENILISCTHKPSQNRILDILKYLSIFVFIHVHIICKSCLNYDSSIYIICIKNFDVVRIIPTSDEKIIKKLIRN